MRRFKICVRLCLICCLTVSTKASLAQLIGVEEDTGNFYSISTTDASLHLIGNPGITGLGSLEFNSRDGSYYGFTTGSSPTLYRFSIPSSLDSVSSQLVGPLDVAFLFEGGLAFSSKGAAYAVNGGVTVPVLLTLDLTTGHATPVQSFDGRHDFAGLGWRNDGMLVGLDSTDNELYAINPTTAALTPIAATLANIGGVGGMAMNATSAYFVTGGPGAIDPAPGSNELYRFDPFTGEQFLIGSFENQIKGAGFSGLTFVPEPATVVFLAVGGMAFTYIACRKRTYS
ncbi:MAG: hypothetical protein HY287_10240 [Planctomycetes bacterium]|nr:hypothetical protein [Planctomycetota bacterium]MBI3834695.1 hypothetical protein [Planctomycetota bacterium]